MPLSNEEASALWGKLKDEPNNDDKNLAYRVFTLCVDDREKFNAVMEMDDRQVSRLKVLTRHDKRAENPDQVYNLFADRDAALMTSMTSVTGERGIQDSRGAIEERSERASRVARDTGRGPSGR